jgi:hypothetical protein
VQFQSPGKHHKRKKTFTDFDNFNKDVLKRKIFDKKAAGEFPTGERLVVKMNEAVGFKGSARSMLRILKIIGFKYARCNDGRMFLMERSNIAAARALFMRTMHNIEQAGHTNINYLDETLVKKNHARKSCWKLSDGSGGLKVPVVKGGHLIICHTGSAASGFIPQSKLDFRSNEKSVSASDYHCEVDAATFKKWFEEDFLPYLAPESVIVMDNASYKSKQRDKPPSTNSRKDDIMVQLSSKNIPHTVPQTRHELLLLVKMNESPAKDYELDYIAREHGRRVPQYHC